MTKDSFGVFEIRVPAVGGRPAIPHNSKLKASHTTNGGSANELKLTPRADLA